ncbi:MAG: cobalt ECF transporter T component CbiQ [Candidatus Omnitrophica bacterium]|nr:cobalt ECF transporter T component CbiQ [Candidatus Omnitrophota bacterium]
MLSEVFSDHFAHRKNYLTEVDIRAKMLLVAAAIIIVVSARHPYVPLIVFFLSLVSLLGIRIPPWIILLRLAAPLSVAGVILVIQIFFYGIAEGLARGFLIMAKVIGATSLVIFLSMTTPVNKLLRGARWFKVPNTWVEIAMLSYRYIFVLLEDAITVRDAQKARLGYSGLARSLRSFGELMGATVIRTYDRSIAVYEAMMLRGYTGTERNIAWEEKRENFMINIMQVKNMRFCYPDGTSALQDINLSVKQGEFLGILGGNGSGKTTLLKILNGLLKTTEGGVYLEETNIKSINKESLFRKVCTMFQNPDDQLFAATVREDVSFGPRNMRLSEEEVADRVNSALNSVGILEFADKPVHNLSYGQKKRACLAGVLAMGPEVILLDEPTACLDPMGVSSIMRLLKEMNVKNQVTLVMTTHSVDLVPLFIDRVVVLDKGKMVKQGAPEEVFSDTATLRQANLRLPQIGHLFEVLKKRDGFDVDSLPLTIGQAREQLKQRR